MECFTKYHECVNSVTPELRNVPILLFAALEEVCSRVGRKDEERDECIAPRLLGPRVKPNLSLEKKRSKQKSAVDLCVCPFSFKAFLTNWNQKPKIEPRTDNTNSYIVEKYDLIGNVGYSYGKRGIFYTEVCLSILKNYTMNYIMKNVYMDNIVYKPHKHSTATGPSIIAKTYNEDQLNHFMYLLLFSTLQLLHATESCPITRNDINKYFQIYNISEEYSELFWNCFEDRTKSEIELSKHERFNILTIYTLIYHFYILVT